MSSLWTPGHEEPGPLGDPSGPGAAAGDDQARAREQLAQIRAELEQTPVADIVANHAIGLWQLAVLHMGLDDEEAPGRGANLPEAKLAIDAMASLVEGVVDRLGDHAEPLRQALTNLRFAYVRVSGGDAGPAAAGTEGGTEAGGETGGLTPPEG